MVFGNWALVLNLASVAVLCFLSSLLLLTVLWPMAEKALPAVPAEKRKLLLWAWVTLPVLTAASAILLFLPAVQDAMQSIFKAAPHWHHLYVFSTDSWHAVPLLMSLAFIAWVAFRHAHRHWRQRQSLRVLDSFSVDTDRRCGHAPVVVLDSDQVNVFSTDTICYVTRGLVGRLTAQELDIVTRHEAAHIERHDGRFRALFSLFSDYFPRPVAGRLRRAYCLATEQLADEAAARRHSALDVASTLVKVSRWQQVSQPGASGLSYFAANQVASRVQQLLDPVAATATLPRHTLLITGTVIVLSSVGMVDGLHHLAEVFFSH